MEIYYLIINLIINNYNLLINFFEFYRIFQLNLIMGCKCAKENIDEENNEISSEQNKFSKLKIKSNPTDKNYDNDVYVSQIGLNNINNIEETNIINKDLNLNELIDENNGKNDNEIEKENNLLRNSERIEKNDNKEKKEELENLGKTDEEKIPEDEFSKYIFENLNKLRLNPSNYINLIEQSKENIFKDHKNRLIYKKNVKVALSKGEESFNEAISILKETKPMNKLIYNPNLVINLPQSEEEIKDKNFFKEKIQNLIKNKVKIKSFWRDIIKDPETCFVLMIVDDSGNKNGSKRRDILNPNFKYIGICSKMIGKSFCCYFIFSD